MTIWCVAKEKMSQKKKTLQNIRKVDKAHVAISIHYLRHNIRKVYSDKSKIL